VEGIEFPLFLQGSGWIYFKIKDVRKVVVCMREGELFGIANFGVLV